MTNACIISFCVGFVVQYVYGQILEALANRGPQQSSDSKEKSWT